MRKRVSNKIILLMMRYRKSCSLKKIANLLYIGKKKKRKNSSRQHAREISHTRCMRGDSYAMIALRRSLQNVKVCKPPCSGIMSASHENCRQSILLMSELTLFDTQHTSANEITTVTCCNHQALDKAFASRYFDITL